MRPTLTEPEFLVRLNHLGLRVFADELATRCGVLTADLFARDRSRPVQAAQAEFYRALRAKGWSTPRVGNLVGRSHSWVVKRSNAGVESTEKTAGAP